MIAGAGDSLKVDFDLSAYRQKVSGNYLDPPPYAGSTFWDGRIGFNLAWNLDFWGRRPRSSSRCNRPRWRRSSTPPEPPSPSRVQCRRHT